VCLGRLVSDADRALYLAKRRGGAQLAVWTDPVLQAARWRAVLARARNRHRRAVPDVERAVTNHGGQS
jgi:hypothetical protein